MLDNQFELILENPSATTPGTKERIKEILSTNSGFKIIDVDEVLSSKTSAPIFRSSSISAVNAMQEIITRAGGRAQIVRQRSSGSDSDTAADRSTFRGFYKHYTEQLFSIMQKVDLAPVEQLVNDMREARAHNRQIFVIGNGGSAATASHFATDFAKSRFDDDACNFRIMSLTDNASWITATGNDDGYDRIFVNQLRNLMQPGDLVIAISSSGNSPSVVKAVEFANERGATTYSIVGFTGGALGTASQHTIYIPTKVGQYGFHEDISLVMNHAVSIFMFERDSAGRKGK